MPNSTESYSLIFMRQSEKAAQFSDGEQDFWLPKSQLDKIEYNDLDYDTLIKGESIEVYVPDWLAEDKGLI